MWFLLVAVILSTFMWWRFSEIISSSGLNFQYGLLANSGVGKFIYSGWARTGIAVLISLVAAAFTAYNIVGPLGRIEKWMGQHKPHVKVSPLVIRNNDTFGYFAELLKQFYNSP